VISFNLVLFHHNQYENTSIYTAMATLSQASTVSSEPLFFPRIHHSNPHKAALVRLRAFKPPPTSYTKLPLSRRAAVLILLFADRRGDLRVILTIRSAKLRNYAGQAALPGGKADFDSETAWQTARREAEEEIGLPCNDAGLPKGYTVEALTELPLNLAMTELGVRPCVAWLKTSNPSSDIAKELLPKLDAREVAAVFTAPFEQFLKQTDQDAAEGDWYRGAWHSWYHEPWRMHMFHVPVSAKTVFKSSEAENTGLDAETAPCSPASKAPVLLADRAAQAFGTQDTQPTEQRNVKHKDALDMPRYRVFGMTARILVDAARVAYGREPEFEHNSHFGDEDMIARLMKMGRLQPKKKKGEILTRDVMQAAAEVELGAEEKGKL
jgi:8-oxo-dGTP pyrophosphatase MutT (NUDIX family)